MNLDILIVEDEAPAARRLCKMLNEANPSFNVLSVTDSIESTIEWLNSGNPSPDLIFMDIQIADGLSFEIFSRVEIKCPVIFTTAYDEYALKAFKVNSIDYLLKPLDREELKNSIEKFIRLNGESLNKEINYDELSKSLTSGKAYKSRFLVNKGANIIPVSTEEIAYFYSEDHVTFIKTVNNNRFTISHSLDELVQTLDPQQFFRANRQYIIKITSIESIQNSINGKLKVQLKPILENKITVSREKAGELKKWLKGASS